MWTVSREGSMLDQGDKFEIIEQDGKIVLIPVAVYPEHVIKNLKTSVEEIRQSIKNGTQPMFDSIDALFEELDR